MSDEPGTVLKATLRRFHAFKQKCGRSPAKAVEIFRVEAARQLLENSSQNID
jgi:transcriptional regulator GlxA family with amidase domain